MRSDGLYFASQCGKTMALMEVLPAVILAHPELSASTTPEKCICQLSLLPVCKTGRYRDNLEGLLESLLAWALGGQVRLSSAL